MSTCRKTLCAAVTGFVLFLTFGGLSAFADPVVGGDQALTAPAATVPMPALTPEDDPIIKPASTPVATAVLAQPPTASRTSFIRKLKAKLHRLRGRVLYYQKATQSWAGIMGTSIRPVRVRHLASMSLPALQKQVVHWKKRSNRLRRMAQNPPHLRQFLCIHRYEGSWQDPNRPYYGGLQMDLGFQRTYGARFLYQNGPEGPLVTADHWTPLEQIWTAEKAVRSRGFHPWPNTARTCGLL